MNVRFTKEELGVLILQAGIAEVIEEIDAEQVDDGYLSRSWAKARAALQEIRAQIPDLAVP